MVIITLYKQVMMLAGSAIIKFSHEISDFVEMNFDEIFPIV